MLIGNGFLASHGTPPVTGSLSRARGTWGIGHHQLAILLEEISDEPANFVQLNTKKYAAAAVVIVSLKIYYNSSN